MCTASYYGHLECVRTLLDGGAAINQATVGFVISMARQGKGCVCGDAWETACMHACVCSWLGALGWHALEGMGER